MQHSKGRENQPCSILKDELPAPPPARLHYCPIDVAATDTKMLPAFIGALLKLLIRGFLSSTVCVELDERIYD